MNEAAVDLLIQITVTLGGAVVAILSFVAITAWRISRGLAERDSKLNQCMIQIDDHEKECESFRDQILKRLDEGSAHFRNLGEDLAYLRGRIDEDKESRGGKRR